MGNKLIFILVLLACGSCSVTPSKQPYASADATFQYCVSLFSDTERSIATTGVADGETARIPGYPFLRVNRFLASYRNEVRGKAWEAWIEQLQQLAMTGFSAEIRNLPADRRRQLEHRLDPAHQSLTEALWQCSRVLRNTMLDEPSERNLLRKNATVPSEYRTWQQIAGFYPLTAPLFRLGIKRWHDETLENYRQPLSKRPLLGRLVRYAPERENDMSGFADMAAILEKSSRNVLHIPLPTPELQQALFDRYAPVFEIDTVSANDRIGAPRWQSDGKPRVDTAKPTVYRRLSHTRLGRRALLQLNYLIWFPSRPKTSAFDLLGGPLDGIIWRVTLLPNGKPWLFDSIHPCGCYHLFFPTPYAKKSAREWTYSEPVFTPQQPVTLNDGDRIVLRISSSSHYIERVYSGAETVKEDSHYDLVGADTLRSLPLPGANRRSWFGQDGLVEGSERGERWLFWPMGIPNPGAMRQWGRHATAFVGRRHFDDPHLLDNAFNWIEQELKQAR